MTIADSYTCGTKQLPRIDKKTLKERKKKVLGLVVNLPVLLVYRLTMSNIQKVLDDYAHQPPTLAPPHSFGSITA